MTDVHKEFITLDKQREHKKEGERVIKNLIAVNKNIILLMDNMKKVLDEENNQ